MNENSIVLVGMSGTGKSTLSDPKRPATLPSLGFRYFGCDDQIAFRLDPWLRQQGFSGGINDVARWMGQPYEPQYEENAERYLHFEVEVMQMALRRLRIDRNPIVVDTTGSVIHTGVDILEELRELATVVMIDAPESHQEVLYQKYLSDPKPVIWGDSYQPHEGEPPLDALKRCYPLMLKRRSVLYRRIADVVVGYDEIRSPTFTVQELVARVKAAA